LDAKQSTLTNSAGLLAALSDETGTGLAVFSTSPSFTTGITTPAITLGATLLTATGDELNYVDGVTSAIQTQLDAKQSTLTNSAGLLAALSDETGTGLAVFSTSPSFTGTVSIANPGLLDLSAIIHDDAAAQGLRLPNVVGAPTAITDNPEGHIAWDATNNLLYVSTDAGWASTFNNTASANTWTNTNAFNSGLTVDATQFTVDGTNGSVSIVPPASMVNGNILNVSNAGLTIIDNNYIGVNVNLGNLTGLVTKNLVGINVGDITAASDGNEYGIYVSGTNWDYGLYVVDTAKFDGALTITEGALTDSTIVTADIKDGEVSSADIANATIVGGDLAANIAISTTGEVTADGELSLGTVATFVDADTTPDVSGSAYWNTNTTGVTITDFDGAGLSSGQVIVVVSKGAIVYDVTTPGGIIGGTTNITTADGDVTTFLYDGTDWRVISRVDQSDDLN
jgi:hypothetical protein